jgi:hypothetical protein
MRRRVTIAILVATVVLGVVPQASAVRVSWTRKVGNWAHAVAGAPDGSVYVAAQRRISISVGALLQKYAPGGALEWSRRWLPNPGFACTRGEVITVAPNGTVIWGGELFGQCEGAGWFLEWRAPGGRLLHRYKTPDWQCGVAEQIWDIAATGDQVIVAGFSHGCCGDSFEDGWIRAFGMNGRPTWETDIEPPAGTPLVWFDSATGLALGGLGNIFVSGWAATERIGPEETAKGTPILVKVTSGGGVLWSRRAPVRVFQYLSPISVAARGDRVVMSAAVAGKGLWWRTNPTSGWLGAFDLGGGFLWGTRWQNEPKHGAQPGGVALGPDGSAWVIGTQRNLHDHDFDLFLRRYGHSGGLQDRFTVDADRDLSGTGVVVVGDRVVATGGFGSPFGAHGGRLWRLAA